MDNRSTLFRIMPKHRSLDEILISTQASKQNPMKLMCLSGEDLLGKLKRIGSKTARTNLPLRLLQRFCLFIGNRMRKRQRTGRTVGERKHA